MADKKFFVTEEELRKAYDDLGSALEVANHYGVSKKLVLTYMKRFGVAKHPRHMITEEIGAQIVQLAGEGCNSQQIADAIGFSLVAVNSHARKTGLTIVDPKHPGVITTWAGYRKLAMPDHPRADSKGYVLEHTLVMEAHIGRFLAPHEVVHHRDSVKGNNTLNNLELMTDTEHRRLHATRGDSGWVKHWATAA
jgi:hypothetical protein